MLGLALLDDGSFVSFNGNPPTEALVVYYSPEEMAESMTYDDLFTCLKTELQDLDLPAPDDELDAAKRIWALFTVRAMPQINYTRVEREVDPPIRNPFGKIELRKFYSRNPKIVVPRYRFGDNTLKDKVIKKAALKYSLTIYNVLVKIGQPWVWEKEFCSILETDYPELAKAGLTSAGLYRFYRGHLTDLTLIYVLDVDQFIATYMRHPSEAKEQFGDWLKGDERMMKILTPSYF